MRAAARVLSCWVVGFALLVPAAAIAKERRPNIVILLADDLGYGDVSAYGGDIPTPHIDALAAGGVRFTDGYVTAPVCNPSRAALLAGRYQQRWGQELNAQVVPPRGAPPASLPAARLILARTLQRSGYVSGAIGKWQLGMTEGHHPLDRGFDYFFGMASESDYVDPAWAGVHTGAILAADEGRALGSRRVGGPLFRDRERAVLQEYLTDQLAKEGIEFIERHKKRPFFLYLSFNAPHTPLQVTEAYYRRFPEIESDGKRIYAGMVAALDDAVGAVVGKLASEKLLEQTLVWFLSDNGAARYVDFDGRRNHPFTGHKRTLYEGGIRVPFAVQWTGRIPSAVTYPYPVSALDIFPTVLAAAGIESPRVEPLDGVNLLPFLERRSSGAPHDVLFWRSAHNRAVRKGDWKLLVSGDSLVRLYDLSRDHGENADLSATHPERVSELLARLERWEAELDAPRKSSRVVQTDHQGDVIEWHL